MSFFHKIWKGPHWSCFTGTVVVPRKFKCYAEAKNKILISKTLDFDLRLQFDFPCLLRNILRYFQTVSSVVIDRAINTVVRLSAVVQY